MNIDLDDDGGEGEGPIEVVYRCSICLEPMLVTEPLPDRSTCGRLCPQHAHSHIRCVRCTPPSHPGFAVFFRNQVQA